MLSFFPRGVLDEILNLNESVSEGFSSYFHYPAFTRNHSETSETTVLLKPRIVINKPRIMDDVLRVLV